jgi:hypothetical protein
MGETITCTMDNAEMFRARLKAHPDLHEFAALLYQAGMIEGLRGAVLVEGGALPSMGVIPVLSVEAEKRIRKMKGGV